MYLQHTAKHIPVRQELEKNHVFRNNSQKLYQARYVLMRKSNNIWGILIQCRNNLKK